MVDCISLGPMNNNQENNYGGDKRRLHTKSGTESKRGGDLESTLTISQATCFIIYHIQQALPSALVIIFHLVPGSPRSPTCNLSHSAKTRVTRCGRGDP